jgi:hypothetical protein
VSAADVLSLVKESRFDEATAALEVFFAPLSAQELAEREAAVEPFTRFTPIFGHAREFVLAAPFFERLVSLVAASLGPEHPHVYRVKRILAGVLSGTDRLPEAIRLQEEVYAFFEPRVPADHPGLMSLRDSLATFYRNAGRNAEADALVGGSSGVCSHLTPLVDDLRRQGARVASVGQPWSERCHVWVFFDAVLDAEALKKRLALPDCVEVHDHRGTHDGAERGLVCREHDDGVMGRHPDLAAGRPLLG